MVPTEAMVVVVCCGTILDVTEGLVVVDVVVLWDVVTEAVGIVVVTI